MKTINDITLENKGSQTSSHVSRGSILGPQAFLPGMGPKNYHNIGDYVVGKMESGAWRAGMIWSVRYVGSKRIFKILVGGDKNDPENSFLTEHIMTHSELNETDDYCG